MKNILLLLVYFFLALATIDSWSQESSHLKKETSNQIKFDSIVNVIIASEQTNSTKIHNLDSLISDNRYAKYTFKTIKKTHKIALKNKDSILIADSYRMLGNYYFYSAKLDSAEYFLLKSKKIVSHKNLPYLNASLNGALGAVYRKRGNITKAIDVVLEAKTILEHVDTLKLSKKEKTKLLNKQIIVCNSLANFHNQIGAFDKAIENYDKAYKKALPFWSPKYLGVLLSNKGDVLLNNGEFEKALVVLKEAKQLKIQGKAQKSSLANTDQNLSLALLKTHKYNLALQHINAALDYFKKNNAVRGLMESYAIRGQIFYAKKEYNSAINDCTKSKELALENNILDVQKKASLCLSKSFEAIKEYKKSLLNYKFHVRIKDSIYNEKNIKKITQLEMQYKYDKEKEIQNLKTISLAKHNKTTIRFLLLGILSLLLVLGLLYWLYSQRQKSNKLLKEKNEKIAETLAVNEVLLKETHHRVKNNLQIISSLLNMQSKFLDDKKSKEIVIDSQNRIKSMSLIHQKLYQENNITGIETKTYLTDLITYLAHSYGIDFKKVQMNISIENVLLDVDTAIPLGLLLNEMISNAFKHGVDKEKGVFSLSFAKLSEEQLHLTIKDNGPGIPENFDWKKSKSYGMKLIHTLSKKLKADIKFENDKGLKISMIITRFKLL